MIPVRLELHNFMAYRDPSPLVFDGIHLACLVGENGAGKSTLLDAITWSLWGKARGRDDELFHLNQTVEEMYVDFHFDLKDRVYRVHRMRQKSGRSSTIALTFQVRDGEGWRDLSEAYVRDTQKKITDELRLDYDTFINSSLLLQGRADEFTTKRPAQRKEVLGSILGLDVWATYEKRAKEEHSACRSKLAMVDRAIEEIDQELATENERRDDLENAQAAVLEASDALREAEAYFNEIGAAQREHSRAKDRLRDLERIAEQIEKDLRRAEEDIAAQEAHIAQYRQVLDEREDIEAGYARWQSAAARVEMFNERFGVHAEIQGQRVPLQQAIQKARTGLEADLRILGERADSAAQQTEEGEEARAALEGVREEIDALVAQEAEKAQLDERETELNEVRIRLESENRQLRAEMDKLKDRMDRLQATEEPVCPLCGQDLGETHRAELIARLEREGAEKGDTWRANKAQEQEITAALEDVQQALEGVQETLRGLPALRLREAQLVAQMTASQEAEARLAQYEKEREALQARINEEDYAGDERARLAELDGQLTALGYDKGEHEAARADVKQWLAFEAKMRVLGDAARGAEEAEQRLAEANALREEKHSALEAERVEMEAVRAELAALETKLDGMEDYDTARRHLEGLRKAEAKARMALGAAKQRLQVLEDQRKQREKKTKERDTLQEKAGIYKDLHKAFSKNGVPTMIIEAAIPEIQLAANDLLGRLTRGQMALRFETQREKKSGEGAIETLDILISDPLGDRNYEMYSGGEAFRVNFAIRIALSRLLARRVGAQLRTLIVDEGFGSQDAAGRERLVEAIHAIKDDFDRIIVITHIDELKDAFPVRIEVTKTDQGSQIQVT